MIITLSRLLQRARADQRGGMMSMAAAVLVPALIILVGLVVDGGGKVTAARHADEVAHAAARAGGDAASTQVAAGRNGQSAAWAGAQRYLAQSGMSGTVKITGTTVQVSTTETYSTVFLPLIGVNSLQGQGTGSARIVPVEPS